MLRIAIVEDDAATRQLLQDYVRRYERQYATQAAVTSFIDGDELVEGYSPSFDVIFLDVEMHRMDGMTAAEHIRRLDKEVVLIFITNMAQFAIRGYAVDAMDYVLKPVPYFAFSQALQKAASRLKKRSKVFLHLPTEKGVIRLDIAEIYYIESEGHKQHVWAESGDWLLAGTLKAMEERLAPSGFARCNNGYLVNLAQVIRVQQNEVMVGPYALQISRPKKKSFLEALTDYIGGVAR